MALKILKHLSSEIAQQRSSVPTFCEITSDSYLLAKNYSKPFSRMTQTTAQAELSNVYDFSTGAQITLGDLDQLNPSLFDEHRLSLAPGQETVARFDF